MKQNSAFESFFNTAVVNDLQKIEPIRQKGALAMKWLIRVTISILILSGLIFLFQGGSDLFGLTLLSGVFLGFGGMVVLKHYMNDYFPYEDKFKKYIVPKIISLISEDLTYRPLQQISINRVRASRLIPENAVFNVEGSDFIHGKYHDVPIMMSYLNAKTTGEDSKTFFNGIFFVADFKKDFEGSVILLPNASGKTSSNMLSRIMGRGRQESYVQMEDIAFGEEFFCYASDDILARYVLSFSFKEKLIHYNKLHPYTSIFFSFVNGSMYLIIDNKRNPFAPSYNKPLTDQTQIKNIFDEIMLIFDVVEVLELNKRIWSKE